MTRHSVVVEPFGNNGMINSEGSRHFAIHVEPNIEKKKIVGQDASEHEKIKYGAEIAYEAARIEYEYCQVRSAKLDNKVYILLTICAFLFVPLTDIIKQSGKIIPLIFLGQLYLSQWCFVILLIITILLFIGMMFLFLSILSAKKIRRFPLWEVLTEDMVWKSVPEVVYYICTKYFQSKQYNDEFIDNRFKKFRWCIYLMEVIIILLLILIFLSVSI